MKRFVAWIAIEAEPMDTQLLQNLLRLALDSLQDLKAIDASGVVVRELEPGEEPSAMPVFFPTTKN